MSIELQEKIIYFLTCTETKDQEVALLFLQAADFHEENAVIIYLESFPKNNKQVAEKELSLFNEPSSKTLNVDEMSMKVIQQLLKEDEELDAELARQLQLNFFEMANSVEKFSSPEKSKKPGFFDKAADFFKRKSVDYEGYKIESLFPGDKTTYDYLQFLAELESKPGFIVLYNDKSFEGINRSFELLSKKNPGLLKQFAFFECHYKSKSGLTAAKILGEQRKFPVILIIKQTSAGKLNAKSVVFKMDSGISALNIEAKLKYLVGYSKQESEDDGLGFDYNQQGNLSEENEKKDFTIEPLTNTTAIVFKMPNGSAETEHKFSQQDTAKDLYDYVRATKSCKGNFAIRTIWPSKIITEDKSTMLSLGLCPNAVLQIQQL